MKKKPIVLALSLLFCVAFSIPVVAEEPPAVEAESPVVSKESTVVEEEPQYKSGQEVEISGKTDFDYYYTYKDGVVDYKCFSVLSDGKRFYASVAEDKYEYCRAAFSGSDCTLKGKYVNTAGDGAPIIKITHEVTVKDDIVTETKLEDRLWSVNRGTPSDPNFKAYYDLHSAGDITVGKDGSYMMIDSNPLNTKGDSFFTYIYKDPALRHMKEINEFLELPEWLYKEMVNTRALDGRQKEVFDNVTVTWSYHPDQGLEVIYRKTA